MTRAASQRMTKMRAALWGSQSWLQPAFSRLSAEHEGSLMTQEPPERRLRARLPAPRLFSRKAPPCASERSSDCLGFGGACFSLPTAGGRPPRLLCDPSPPQPAARVRPCALPSTRLASAISAARMAPTSTCSPLSEIHRPSTSRNSDVSGLPGITTRNRSADADNKRASTWRPPPRTISVYIFDSPCLSFSYGYYGNTNLALDMRRKSHVFHPGALSWSA